MQKHPLILVLLAASGISHAAGLCDDLDADAPPVEYAAKSAPVLQKAAVSPQAQAIPDEWWADADRDAALWATPAEGTAPLDFLWHYYLSIHGEYYRFLLQPEPLPSARITLYKLKEIVPSDRYGTPRETIIATLKAALISKTASGEHEAFFNF